MRAIILLFCVTGIGQAFQSYLTCTNASGIPKTIRDGGLAELVSDIVVTCTGGNSGDLGYNNIQIFLTSNVTSRILDSTTGATEVFLLIDDPATPVPGQSLFQGYLAAANSISFQNIPIAAPGPSGTRTLRITNLRANASYTPTPYWLHPTQLGGFLSIIGSSMIAMQNPEAFLGNFARGLTFGLRNSSNAPITSLTFQQAGGLNTALATSATATGGALTHTLVFTEGFITAFNKRNTATTAANPSALANQNVPGTNYGTESGYYNSSLPSTGGMNVAGLATQGTRLIAQFSGVPAGIALYVTVSQTSGPAARLVAGGPYSPIAQTTTANGVGIAPVQLTAGAGSATWEVLDADPAAIDKLEFGVAVAYLAPQASPAPVSGNFAPLSAATAADSTSPVPRFPSPVSTSFSQCTLLPCLQTQSAVTFNYRVGDPLPAAVSVPLESTGPAINFSFSSSTSNGITSDGTTISPAIANWLSVGASGGVTPASLTLSANPTNFSPGQYPALITLTSNGAGNSPQSISVMLNVLPPPTGTPFPMSCSSNAGVPPLIRAEGLAEPLGDIILICTGGTPGTLLNLSPKITLNTNVTSKMLNTGNSATEALLLVDEPGHTQKLVGTNLFQGTLVANNAISFGNVPVTVPAASGVRILRLTNLRADARALGISTTNIPNQVVATLLIPGVGITNPTLTAGYSMPGKLFALRTAADATATAMTFQQSGGSGSGVVSYLAKFTELFASGYKKRGSADQDTPGTSYNTESIFDSTLLPATNGLNQAGYATQGTRLMARFNNVPPGVTLYATVTNLNSGTLSARLITTDSQGAGAYSATTQTSTASYNGAAYGIAPVTIVNGSGIAVWEVLDASPFAVEEARFGIVAAYSAPLQGSLTVNGVLAPLSLVEAADSISPVPRFGDGTCPASTCPVIPVAAIAITGAQSTAVNTVFPSPLKALIIDANSNPVAGASVTFGINSQNSASAAFPGDNWTVTVVSDASGTATSPVVLANSFSGTYSVDASVPGGALGATFTLTNYLSSYSISGQVTGAPGSTLTLIGTQSRTTIANSSGSYALTGLTPAGTFTITPSLAGYTFRPASSTFTNLGANQTANFAGGVISNLSFTVSPSTVILGQPVTVRATVTPSAATGTVTFYEGSNIIGARPISAGIATLVTSLLPAGTRSLRAYYGGDATYSPIASASAPLLITANSSNSFVKTSTIVNGNTPLSIAIGDFDGDGKADFVTANYGARALSIFLGNGDGTFRSQVNAYVLSENPWSVAVGDFNRDGKSDLVVATSPGFLKILLGNGDGTFQPAVSYAGSLYSTSVAVGDFNGDGKADLVSGNGPDGISILLGNGDGTFQSAVNYAIGNSANFVAIGDFNGDGRPDVVTASGGSPGTVSILLGNGDGTLQSAASYAVGGGPSSVAIGDFNGDGKLDLATSNAQGVSLSVLLGNGDGTFQSAVSYGVVSPSAATFVTAADINGDGKCDLISTNPGAETVGVWLGNGDGTFQPPVMYPADFGANAVVITDFNGDGRSDLAVMNTAAYNITIHLGASTDTTPPTVAFNSPTSASTYSTSIGTLNISGTASDNIGVTQVTWICDRCGSGTAVGTTSWAVSNIALLPGANVITLKARDAAGNQGTAMLNVTLITPQSPTLSIAKSHTGNFNLGQSNASYLLTVSNASGAGPSSGVVTVTDTVPTGLALVSMSGSGWLCTANTCTRSDVLNGGASYPSISVLVNVSANAPGSVTNSASVSGGGSVSANASDPTTITPLVHNSSVVSLAPVTSTGASQSYTFQFADTSGSADLTVLNVLINSSLDGRHACYLAYVQQSNTLFLVNDAGDPGGPFAGGLVLNGSGNMNNSQCTISGAGSSAVANGNTLTLTLNINFSSSFGGNKVIYMAARDTVNNNSGWQTMGMHGVPPLPATFPMPGGMSPSSGAAAASTLSLTFNDAASATNLQTGWALINTAIDGRAACYVAYFRPGNQIYLFPDNGDGTMATSIVLSGTNTISNSQCTISSQGSSVTASGAQLIVNLNITFNHSFSGPKGVWMAAQTMGGLQTSEWQALGTWRVP